MKTEHIRYILETAQCPSIHRASELLYLSPQHLSSIITSVEKEIGCVIFNRTTTGLFITETGQKVIEKLEQIDEQYHELLEIPTSANQSDINTALVGDFYFYRPDALKIDEVILAFEAVVELFPNINFHFFDHPSRPIYELVSENKNSAGVLVTERTFHLPEFQLPENVEMIPLKELTPAALISKNHPLAQRNKTVSVKRMLEEDFIVYGTKEHIDENIIYNVLRQFGTPRLHYFTTNVELFYKWLEENECITFVAYAANADYSNNTVAIPIRDKIRLTYNIVLNKEADNPRITRALVDEIMKTNR